MLPTPLPNLYAGAFQLAYVTTDLEQAIATYREHYGVTSFVSIQSSLEVSTPEGVKSAQLDMAFGYIGEIQIELIQPIEGNLTLYADELPDGPAFALRFHHVGCRLRERAQWDAFRAGLDPGKHRIAFESMAPAPQSRFLYLDERARLGHYLEYMWLDAQASEFFDAIPRN
jgi:Glyoxalase/Bleomycin resistance protein/Dioxygenase superfamily